MTREIKFKASFGDVDRQVELSKPRGGGGSWHIYVDRRVYGHIINAQEGWRVILNGTEFNQGDADALLEFAIQHNLDSWE